MSPYGTSKLAAEEYLATWNRLYGTGMSHSGSATSTGLARIRTVRPGVVAIFLSRIRDGQEATIYGDGSQTRDYVFARDVARAFVGAVGAEGGVFNVGTGEETSVVALWDACLAAAGKETSAVNGPARLGELQRSCLDPRRAETTLHWRAEVPLSTGLRDTWEWIREE